MRVIRKIPSRGRASGTRAERRGVRRNAAGALLAVAVTVAAAGPTLADGRDSGTVSVDAYVPYRAEVVGRTALSLASAPAQGGEATSGFFSTGDRRLRGAEIAGLTMCVTGARDGRTSLAANWLNVADSPRRLQLAFAGDPPRAPFRLDSSESAQATGFANPDIDCIGDPGLRLRILDEVPPITLPDGILMLDVEPE